ncbi:hypothetical protein [Streptomyces sp. NWU339]|uniref:hypothetical protein n=1 Tax=Streptomyces sp. NWU339 TaxID=2185284 RepID=UPI0015E7FA34|nr:hypothetical protein [Streptomyces sp. NWU339]
MTASIIERPTNGPVPVEIAPLKDNAIILIGDLETIVESEKCSCNAGDDNPY